MTWDQFKERIDKTLKEHGRDGSIKLEYVRFWQSSQDELEILVGKEVDADGVQIWNYRG